jgi:hypothetical protein
MAKVEKIIHNDQNIIYLDVSGFMSTDEISPVLEEAHEAVKQMGSHNARLLSNVEDTRFSKEISEVAKLFVRRNSPYMKASAIVGVKGVQLVLLKSLLKMSGRDIKRFDTQTEALDWLAAN